VTLNMWHSNTAGLWKEFIELRKQMHIENFVLSLVNLWN